eukprot:CAMPEP_0178704960 /NCGR_PEP_ID=MMETSP0699-20121125/14503_1 /TAXON_ID=265572 /ORGANISM="Extubocellulus spinifer, Strain CCMP396" /LENGTH=412 /DNA_ID=CAMNT_0020352431 /DNA_START=95 /DNA_END=1336 /DNA_ORIENTATION=+
MAVRTLPMGFILAFYLACTSRAAAAFTPAEFHVQSSLQVPSKAATACPTRTCTNTGTRFASAQGHFLLHMSSDGNNKERDVMDEMNFFKADIPAEIRAEIFEAEAKTQAGQERSGRLANYAAIVVFGLGTAIFNTFLTGLQEDGSTLAETGFGWIQGNPINSFLFTSKIGGAIALVSAGLSAVMSEVEVVGILARPSTYMLNVRILWCILLHVQCTEYSSGYARNYFKKLLHVYTNLNAILCCYLIASGKKENVEKIWQEVQKRKEERERGGGKSRAQRKKKGGKNKKKMQKQAKRLAALSEVMVDDDEGTVAKEQQVDVATTNTEDEEPAEASTGKKEEGGILGKMKGFYEQADSMAASQALLLNKELEDRGVVEKITDESGLKVIGREAASKLKKSDDGDSISESKKKKE